MISVYLVVFMGLASAELAPVVIEPSKDLESCLVKAEKLNKSDALGLKKGKDLVAAGAEVACINVVRDLV